MDILPLSDSIDIAEAEDRTLDPAIISALEAPMNFFMCTIRKKDNR